MSGMADKSEGSGGGVPGSPPALAITTSDWSYLAEGGFHIILRYDGDDPKLKGNILRIGKKALGHVKQGGGEGAEASVAAPAALDEAGARRRFERGVLMPLLGTQYVQPGDAVDLSREDIDKIHARLELCKQLSSKQQATTRLLGYAVFAVALGSLHKEKEGNRHVLSSFCRIESVCLLYDSRELS